MMIALLLALAAAPPAPPAPAPPASIDGLPLGVLARQELPARGCAAYLFTTGQTRAFAAMATAEPAALRIALDGTVTDLPRASAADGGQLGFAAEATYRAGATAATLAMTVLRRDDLQSGAIVSAATLTIDRAGRDTVVVPLGGLVGCAG